MRIFITGYMGCGKSTLGKKLANRLHLKHIDLDEYFEQKFRTSITLFFERFSEESFRSLEHEVLKEVIENNNDVVISTGGGTPCFHDNMDLMNKHGLTIYLKIPAAMLASRLSNSPFRYRRPKLKGLDKSSMLQTVHTHLEERDPFYSKAQLVIEPVNLDINEIAEQIAAKVDGEGQWAES